MREIQYGREEYWKKRVQENIPTSSETPVAVAGRNHFRNTVDVF
ncbi:MAG: hypothetical protein QMD14_05905 [Candidatus Aenigmarchaeota archaeon]|nr:hypothetical protein [Candidatus Aenigmarchaeota archaeon]